LSSVRELSSADELASTGALSSALLVVIRG
jgi:hypothetical protein